MTPEERREVIRETVEKARGILRNDVLWGPGCLNRIYEYLDSLIPPEELKVLTDEEWAEQIHTWADAPKRCATIVRRIRAQEARAVLADFNTDFGPVTEDIASWKDRQEARIVALEQAT